MKFLRIIRQQTPIIIVVILVLGNTIWHRFIPDKLMFLHNIYPLLYQFPIVLAGFYFGRIGGVTTAAAVAALSIPHFLYLLHSDPMYLYKSFIEIVLYFIIGYTIGHIADAMRKEQREKQRLLEDLRITEKNTTLGEIAHVISHELKTPIASITGAVDLLVEDDAADDKKRIRDIIHKELLRMNNLIGGTFQTFHENRIEKKDIPIELFFDEIRTLHTITHSANPVSLTISVVTKIKTMHVSHELLREAFLNLIDNAVEASTPNGRVDITIEDNKDHFVYSVKDNGEGMSEQTRQNLFKPFFTTKKRGTGLGVAITKRIVELHGGFIDCTSSPGAGTEFTIRIPRHGI